MFLGAYRRLMLRRLLQLDRPVLPRSDADVAAEVERNYRWNFGVNLLDVVFFWFGLSFISSATIVPLFISKLSPNPLFIGLAAMIAQGAWYLPQLLTAYPIERLPRKKAVLVNLGFFLERAPMWVVVLAAPMAVVSPPVALLLFFIGYAWHGLGTGIVAPAWQDLIAKCFPVLRRGRFLGLSLFLGAGAGTISALVSIRLLEDLPFPGNFTVIFAGAAASITLSWFFLAMTREPVAAVEAPRRDRRQFLADLSGILKQDANFRRFLAARVLLVLGSMASGFVTVAAVWRWDVPDSRVGVYTAELLIGQTASNLILGLLADRYGHKLSLELGALAALLAYSLAWLAPSPGWYDLVFILMGIASGAFVVSGILIVMEFAPAPRRPTYAGLANTITGLAGVIGPLLGAGLASIGYNQLFAASALLSLVAWLAMRWWVREPRLAPPAGAAR